jgi:hypothetical protein
VGEGECAARAGDLGSDEAEAMKPFKGVETIKAAPDHELEVVFKGDPKAYRVDVAGDFAGHGLMKPLLADPAAFAQVKVIYDGDGVGWTDDLDMCGEYLWRLAHIQAGDLMATKDFQAWRACNELSLTGAAKALGLSRRMVAYYDSGERPIPKTVQLACPGYEVARERGRAA